MNVRNYISFEFEKNGKIFKFQAIPGATFSETIECCVEFMTHLKNTEARHNQEALAKQAEESQVIEPIMPLQEQVNVS
jgi:hypothetical protein